jgi:hypothetical protein
MTHYTLLLLTLGWITGYEYSFTFPKSSAVAISFPSCERSQWFTSVPSAPSGQMPRELKVSTHELLAHSTSRSCDDWGTWRHKPAFPMDEKDKATLSWLRQKFYNFPWWDHFHKILYKSLKTWKISAWIVQWNMVILKVNLALPL